MKFPKALILNILFLFILIHSFCFGQLNIVSTKNGMVSGFSDSGVNIFKGIPYAEPPLGDLRWKAPQPLKNWVGVKKCLEFSASPCQPNPVPFLCWSEEFITPPKKLDENCLYLNIWTAAKTKTEKRPVFVWIYGGGFSSGSAACAIYDGEEMAKRGIIFVSINYRVGVLGFLAHPELTKEQGKASGNYGIMDQIAALKWVKENIQAFGGDPEQVTIGGQSAGSFSVNALVASPMAKGLFQRAIAESGGLLPNRAQTHLNEAEKLGLIFQEKAGVRSLADLRKLPADTLIKIQQKMGPLRMGLTLDDYIIPQNLMDRFKTGNFNEVPLLTGWVSGDGALAGPAITNAEKSQKEALEKYGDKAKIFLEAFPANTDEEAKSSQLQRNLLGFAGYPSYLWAIFNPKPSYLYQISHVPTDKKGFPNYGAFHTSEVPYALHTLHLWKRNWQEHDYEVENLLSSYWLNFIKTGNPNGTGLPEWKRFEKTGGYILEVNHTALSKPEYLKKQFDALQLTQTGEIK